MSVVRLTLARTELEAEMICGRLRAHGIGAETRRTEMSAAIVGGSRGGGPTEIVADDRELEAARALLAAGDS